MADESTIKTSYIPQSWGDNVIISDTRMETIENGIVNLYTAIFGTNEVQDVEPIFDKIDDLWDNIGEKNDGESSIFNEIHSLKDTTTAIRADLGTKSDNTAFDEINSIKTNINTLSSNLGEKGNNNSAFDEINVIKTDITTANTNISTLLNNLGNKGNNNDAFAEISNIKNNLGNQGNNSNAFTEINNIKSNLGDKGNNSDAFTEINSLKSSLNDKTDSSTTTAIRNDLGNKTDTKDKETAFGRIKHLETTVDDLAAEDFESIAAEVMNESMVRAQMPYRSVQILLDDAQYRQSMLNLCYPIGSIYITMAPTNPSNFLGGKWIEWSQGRVIVGAKDEVITVNDTSFDLSAGSTGGEYGHTLTIDEMPSHTHAVANYNNNSETQIPAIQGGTGRATILETSGIQNTGGSQAHSIIQPYVSCYIWKRVAEDITELIEAIGNNTYTGIFQVHDIIPMKLKDGTSMDLEIIDIDSENNQVKLVSVDVIEDSLAEYSTEPETGVNELPIVLNNFQTNKMINDWKDAMVDNSLWIPSQNDVENMNTIQKGETWWIKDGSNLTYVYADGSIEEGYILSGTAYVAFGITITSLQPYVNIPTDATGNLF